MGLFATANAVAYGERVNDAPGVGAVVVDGGVHRDNCRSDWWQLSLEQAAIQRQAHEAARRVASQAAARREHDLVSSDHPDADVAVTRHRNCAAAQHGLSGFGQKVARRFHRCVHGVASR